ncbi:hypothetical protein QTP88_012353 [Uroleucon formosanum]
MKNRRKRVIILGNDLNMYKYNFVKSSSYNQKKNEQYMKIMVSRVKRNLIYCLRSVSVRKNTFLAVQWQLAKEIMCVEIRNNAAHIWLLIGFHGKNIRSNFNPP